MTVRVMSTSSTSSKPGLSTLRARTTALVSSFSPMRSACRRSSMRFSCAAFSIQPHELDFAEMPRVWLRRDGMA